MDERKIGFFDSGVGGLSVLKTAVELMPEEDFIYYGDTAHSPYGGKDKKEIEKLTFDCINMLMQSNIKALVIACNTATSAAIDDLRNKFDIPIIGMEPAIKPAILGVSGRILVMATPATIKFTKYNELLDKFEARSRVHNLQCKELAALIENNILNNEEAIDNYLNELLMPYVESDFDAVVLGCTHYVFIKDKIKALFPEKTKIFHGNDGAVRRLMDILEKNDLRCGRKTKGHIILNSSSDNQYTMKIYSKLLYGI